MNKESQNKHIPHKAERMGNTDPDNLSRLLQLKEGKGEPEVGWASQSKYSSRFTCKIVKEAAASKQTTNKWGREGSISAEWWVEGAESGPRGPGWGL